MRQSAYEDAIRVRIQHCLALGPKSLVDVIRSCAGAYPTVVADCLSHMNIERFQSEDILYRLGAAFSDFPNPRSILEQIEGNPVFSSWYFTDTTCNRLASLSDWTGARLAFLGTPRLFEWFLVHELGAQRVLFDADRFVLDHLRKAFTANAHEIHEYNTRNEFDSRLHEGFDYVFFDPPWYPYEYFLWFFRAAQLAPQGRIYAAIFPELTRPTASLERAEIIATLSKYSHSVTTVLSALEYSVPSFERAQLKASGLGQLSEWRLGDLLIVEARNLIEMNFPSAGLSGDEWVEVDLGPARFFIDLGKSNENERFLSAPEQGRLVLTSPSRRNPALQNVNVLTSRGHGLIASHPILLKLILQDLDKNLRDGHSIEKIIDSMEIDPTSRAVLREVIRDVTNG